MKSKKSLNGEEKYYLTDLSFYFVKNTDNRINFGPVLENIVYNYLKSSRFVYVPILADYQRALNKINNKSIIDCIIYPRNTLEVKKKEPFSVFVGYSEEKDHDYIYPSEDK